VVHLVHLVDEAVEHRVGEVRDRGEEAVELRDRGEVLVGLAETLPVARQEHPGDGSAAVAES